MELFWGFEMGNVFVSGDNKLLVLGGKKNYGTSNSAFEYDFLNETVKSF